MRAYVRLLAPYIDVVVDEEIYLLWGVADDMILDILLVIG